MISIQALFDVTKNEESQIPKKYRKRLNRACKHFNKIDEVLPNMTCPQPGTSDFLKDIDSVKFYYGNPSLSNNFLDMSGRSVEECFRVFCDEMGIDVGWKKIGKLLDEVDTVLLKLKFAHMRPRPKHYLIHESEYYEAIKESKSPSFPSGHTAIAYFVANLLSDAYPQIRPDAEMMANLIGQSRIENGVHFPTDVSAGKLVGQFLFEVYKSKRDNNVLVSKIKKEDYKNFANFLIKKNKDVHRSIEDLSNYLYLTNKVENFDIPYGECYSASKKMHQGFPVNYITDNEYLKSTILPLIYSYKIKSIDSPFKIISMHKHMLPSALRLGAPGEIRSHDKHADFGHSYADTESIYGELINFCNLNPSDSFLKHAFFIHIQPFSDGSGRIGRAILCNDLGYDFSKVNHLLGYNYINKLKLYFDDLK